MEGHVVNGRSSGGAVQVCGILPPISGWGVRLKAHLGKDACGNVQPFITLCLLIMSVGTCLDQWNVIIAELYVSLVIKTHMSLFS